MSFHARLVGRTLTQDRVRINALAAAMELFSLIGEPSVAQIEAEFDLDDTDAEWAQFKQMYDVATNKRRFLAIAANAMRLAEGGHFGMDDSTTFFNRLTNEISGV
jgi:hypothetical protein